MIEPGQNSLERLTEEMVQATVWQYDGAVADARIIAGACPEALRRATESAVSLLNATPDSETVMEIILTGFVVGWRAREALMESEELERLAR